MKKTLYKLGGLTVIAAAMAFSPLAFGDAAVTTTTSDGTISEFSPEGNSIVLHAEGNTAPMRYSYSKSTTIVDEAGNPVDVSVVKTGIPVQVYYDRDGDSMVARRIVVHHHVEGAPAVSEHRETTTTTTTDGHEHERDHDKDHDR